MLAAEKEKNIEVQKDNLVTDVQSSGSLFPFLPSMSEALSCLTSAPHPLLTFPFYVSVKT